MTQVILDGDEIVICVSVSAVVERAVQQYDLDVSDHAGFAAEIVDDLNRDPVGVIADVAGSMIEAHGSSSVTSNRETHFKQVGSFLKP